MNSRDALWLEWDRAYAQFGPDEAADLLKLDVAPTTLLDALIGVEWVEFDGEIYHPSDDGRPAFILPVIEWVPDGPFLDDHGHIHPDGPPEPEPVLVDLIAWHPNDPERWWCRRGEPALILGQTHLETAAWFESPVRVFRNPLNWLRDGCRGVVLINRTGLEAAFTGIQYLDAQNLAHGQQLHAWLHQPTQGCQLSGCQKNQKEVQRESHDGRGEGSGPRRGDRRL